MQVLRDLAAALRAWRRRSAEAKERERWLHPSLALPDHEFGTGTYGVPRVLWHAPGRKLVVGNYCSLAPEVTVMLGGNHCLSAVSTYPFAELSSGATELPQQEYSNGNVEVGSDVWIGMGALILSGITIGHGAVIGARSVITRDVEPYSIVAGNPARHIRYRVPKHCIADLLDIAWWNWPPERVAAARKELLTGDVETFVKRYRRSTVQAVREGSS